MEFMNQNKAYKIGLWNKSSNKNCARFSRKVNEISQMLTPIKLKIPGR